MSKNMPTSLNMSVRAAEFIMRIQEKGMLSNYAYIHLSRTGRRFPTVNRPCEKTGPKQEEETSNGA